MIYSMLDSSLLRVFSKILVFFVTIFTAGHIGAQSGLYELKNKNGSYSYISLIQNKNHITAEIFAWWNTPNAQTGSYYGQGILKNNSSVLKSNENDPECSVTIKLADSTVDAVFAKCTVDHLTEDFNGLYRKISEATAGDYEVISDKSFFYSKPAEKYKQKAYLIKGDTVAFNLDGGADGNWVYVHYQSTSGKEKSGYLKLSDLKKNQ